MILTLNSGNNEEEKDEVKATESTKFLGTNWNRPQFFVQDLQRVVLYGLIGTHYRFFPRYLLIFDQIISFILNVTYIFKDGVRYCDLTT